MAAPRGGETGARGGPAGAAARLLGAALAVAIWATEASAQAESAPRLGLGLIPAVLLVVAAFVVGALLWRNRVASARAEEESKAKQSEVQVSQYARSLLEASLDPLVTISPQGKITDVNEATVKVTGLAREALVGTDFSDYFTEPDKARRGYERVFAEGFVTDYPLTIRHREGRLVDVLYNASVYRDVEGKVQGVFAAARDVTETKRVLREFAETKNFLDNILQSSTRYSIIGKDLNHHILSWNEGARLNYGYREEEVINRESSILHAPEDLASGAVAQLLKTAYEKGLSEGEFQRVRKDGSRFTANLVVTRRNDPAGNAIGYLLVSTDITEKKQAEEKLRFAFHYARSLIEASLDPLVTISPEGKITDVNEATVSATGVPRQSLIGTDFSNYFIEPDRARDGYRRVFDQGFVTDYPLTIRHAGGKLSHVLYNASVYKDAVGKILGVFDAARDVTGQRLASQYARSLIEASLDPLVTISPEGKITDVNEATVRVTGMSRERLIGTDFSNYFTEPEKAREGYRQVFEKGYVTDYPLTLRHAQGQLVHVLYNASVYKDPDGKILGVFAAARDVTERRRAEDSLHRVMLEIQDSVSILTEATAQILTTTTEVAAGASETATAVSETTSTVEEVKQTAHAAHEKAKNVSEGAQRAVGVAQAGRTSVEESVAGMNRIHGQMESIAESIVRLSEQSQTIGEITASVNDLAEQSTMLAVNAAIEAAKAGDQGKGFAVVAQEVKSLAEQSKQATAQVRGILNEIQKATNAAVLATEQGSRAVDEGVRQSKKAGDAILEMGASIEESARAALQIAASSQQQLLGMDQVARAMENVKL
ncbi:MAG: PAS domain-containing methyl-accepting chemotaxis protein, partial [Deltaproteobacteria bacterium]|nr:PAS domain-containing methyl-accepting chemotaxis protein [Deltaproteobacteria bacterium]